MRSADNWISELKLLPHPEGGFYRETYRSGASTLDLPAGFDDRRDFSTAIYFLLRSEDRSCFHRIKSDELWHYHAGSGLTIYVLMREGLVIHKLGQNLESGELPQVVIPANCWFGAKVNEAKSYVLAGCTVSPGFDFRDFEMANREKLLAEFPIHQDIIKTLT